MALGSAQPRSNANANEPSLVTYEWVALDKRNKLMKGEMQGKNAALVKAELRRQGMNPRSVKERPKPLFGNLGKKVKARDVAIFSRQLSTMMNAGVPLVQAFEIIAGGQQNQRFKNMLNDVRYGIESGASLYEALGRYPLQFDDLYRNLVRAGESAGVLDTVLATIATYKERIEAIKAKIKKALFYPSMVMLVALGVTMILLLFVIPVFQQTFRDAGTELPAPTQFVIAASSFMQSYWWLVIGGLIAVGVGSLLGQRQSKTFAQSLDRLSLRLPVIGRILRQSAIARFARTLGVTFQAGVPLVDALDAVAGATGSVVYGDAVRAIREDVSVGHQMQLAMRQTGLFPDMVVQMTAIGEESGALDSMLFKVADFYEDEVNNAVDTLSSLLEPLIMVVLGLLVGGMVIAIYLPIFKMAGNV